MIFARRASRDPVADNLRTLAKQGRGMARIAHLFGGLLIILFSAASFIALGSEALARFQASMARGAFDLPDAISLAVVVLIVPAFDWGMIYAAHRVNLLITRKADRRDMRVHVGVIVLATLVEGASYIYMSILYEHPATLAAWAIIVIRGLSAPLLAVYLAMARALPVTPRDILYQGELAAGAGVLRDVALAANDQSAPLAQKMALYGAAAEMRDHDRARLDKMIEAVQAREPLHAPPPPHYPTGGGTPSSAPNGAPYEPDEMMNVVESWPRYSGAPLPPVNGPVESPDSSPDSSPVRTLGEPGWASAPTMPSTAVMSPVRTQEPVSRAEVARTAAAALRERRIELIMGWFRAADTRGKARPSVRVIVSRIRRMEPDRKRNPISESTAGALMRQASDRLTWETAQNDVPAERSAQVAQ